jgi:hypothetical protein
MLVGRREVGPVPKTGETVAAMHGMAGRRYPQADKLLVQTISTCINNFQRRSRGGDSDFLIDSFARPVRFWCGVQNRGTSRLALDRFALENNHLTS